MNRIFYHQIKPGVPCPDGLAAAWVAQKAYPDALIQGVCYQEEPPEVAAGDRIIIVDFSYPPEVIKKWGKNCEVIMIDHHKTAWEQWINVPLTYQISPTQMQRGGVKIDLNQSGATLAWQIFFPERSIPVFLKYVRDRDLWTKQLQYCDEVHEALSSLRYGMKNVQGLGVFDLYDTLALLSEAGLLSVLLPIGVPLIQEKKRQVREIANRFVWKLLRDGLFIYRIPFLQLNEGEDRLTSDIAEYIYRENFVEFVMILGSDGVSYSLRSNKDESNFDVAALAEKYGGGGHRNAAGFKQQEPLNFEEEEG